MQKDNHIIKILQENSCKPVLVELEERNIIVWNIAWGYDFEDEFAHITSNISPGIAETAIDFFYTHEIKRIVNMETKAELYPAATSSERTSE